MGEEKLQVEAAGRVQERNRLFQVLALARIGPSPLACREIQEQFGGSGGLSHPLPVCRGT